ncbi:hypothetical protein AGMMS50284_4840 [Clostridia bacterium]|nr:hypothetical protein AGMMS50284_4840 [Clostridia bacterium]
MVKSDGSTIQYKYDQDGLRTTKTIDGTSTRYVYDSGQLVSMKTANGTPLYFRYDTTGKPVSVKYENNEYFYVTNIFGDITGIVDKLGVSKVAYTYDAWGAPLTTTGTLASTLGAANPLRYRGYVFDSETGLYYLQSRYYNPQWKRFVNADDTAVLTLKGRPFDADLFLYCKNNAIMYIDPDGYKAIDITQKLYTLMRSNAFTFAHYILLQIFTKGIINGLYNSLVYFYKKVKNKGDWDLKMKKEWQLKSSSDYFVFMGKKIASDAPGNIHFGFVGSVLIPGDILRVGAGLYQLYIGKSHWYWFFTFFDQPRDSGAILIGSALYKKSIYGHIFKLFKFYSMTRALPYIM